MNPVRADGRSEDQLTVPSLDELFRLYAVDCRNNLVAYSLYRVAQGAADCDAGETVEVCTESLKRLGQERLRFLSLVEFRRGSVTS